MKQGGFELNGAISSGSDVQASIDTAQRVIYSACRKEKILAHHRGVRGIPRFARNDGSLLCVTYSSKIFSTENLGNERYNVTGNCGSSGEAGRFDTHQLDDLRKFAVGFNDKINDAFA